MEPSGRLEPQPWMMAEETRKVIAALGQGGDEPRFIGGCVRDALLGRPVKDIDIATREPPERVMTLLAEAGIRAIPTGIAHGTVTAVIGAMHFEITTLRRDVKSRGRHADVAFTDDWTEDAARRDFTINALSVAPDGRLFDPFGGLEDLKLGRVRFVGDAETRIREDVLRLLRFFRFFACYDRPPPDPAAWEAAVALTSLLPRLSGERVWSELRRMMEGPDPAAAFALMNEAGALAPLLPEGTRFARLAALCRIESAIGTDSPVDPLLRLAALIETDAAGARQIARRLRLSRRENERLQSLCTRGLAPSADMADAEARRRIHAEGNALFRDRILLAWSEESEKSEESEASEASGDGSPDAAIPHVAGAEGYRRLLDLAARWMPPSLPLSGADVLARGVAPGPAVGAVMEAVESWWIDEDFRPGRKACLARMDALLRNSPPSSPERGG